MTLYLTLSLSLLVVVLYLNGCQVLLFLRRSLVDKPKPVGVARVTGVQDVEHVALVPPDLPHRPPQQQVHNNITDIPVLNRSLWSAF